MSKLFDKFILACTKIDGEPVYIQGSRMPRCILQFIDQFTGERESIFIDFKKDTSIGFSPDFKTTIHIDNILDVGTKKDAMVIKSRNSETSIDKYANTSIRIK